MSPRYITKSRFKLALQCPTRAIAQKMNDRKGLANLDRYRSSIQRHLSGLLRELKWLQDARAIEVAQVAPAADYNRDTADVPALLETGDGATGETKDRDSLEYPAS